MNVYDQMIDVIEERGFTSGTLVDEDGSCCLLGAAYLVQNPEDSEGKNAAYFFLDQNPVVLKMCKEIRPSWPEEQPTIPVYNFSDTSTKEEVIEFLKRMSEKEDV